jgi:hypothetical protein
VWQVHLDHNQSEVQSTLVGCTPVSCTHSSATHFFPAWTSFAPLLHIKLSWAAPFMVCTLFHLPYTRLLIVSGQSQCRIRPRRGHSPLRLLQYDLRSPFQRSYPIQNDQMRPYLMLRGKPCVSSHLRHVTGLPRKLVLHDFMRNLAE